MGSLLESLYVLSIFMAFGVWGRAQKVFGEYDAKALSSYVFYIALPCLFFDRLTTMPAFTAETWTIIIGSVSPVLLLEAVLLLLLRFHVIKKDLFFLLSLSILFGSNSFFGIAFFESLYGEWGHVVSTLSAQVLGIVGIVGTIMLFEYQVNGHLSRKIIREILVKPPMIGIIAGVIGFIVQKHLSPSFLMPFHVLGRTSGPVAIVMLGMFLYDNMKLKDFRFIMIGTLWRTIALPVMTAFTLFFMSQATGDLKTFLFLQSGIPCAVSISVFAEQYNYRAKEVASLVLATSLISFPLIALLFFLGRFV